MRSAGAPLQSGLINLNLSQLSRSRIGVVLAQAASLAAAERAPV